MGVLFDYFRAPDREVARLIGRRDGGPFGAWEGADASEVDGIEAKGLDPDVIMGQLMAMVLDQPWDPGWSAMK